MTTSNNLSGRSRPPIPTVVWAPLAVILLVGIVLPRLLSQQSPSAPQFNWAAMHSYAVSVSHRYPRVRQGYEKALVADRRQLAGLDRRIPATTDPAIRAGLERQRAMVASAIQTVEQIIIHLPAPLDRRRG